MRVVTSHTGRPSFVGRWIRADRLVVQASKFGPSFQWYDASTHKRAAGRLCPWGHRGRDRRRSGWDSERQCRRSPARAAGAHSRRPLPRRRDVGSSVAAVRAHVLDRVRGGYGRRGIGHQSATRRDIPGVLRVDGVLDSIKASGPYLRPPVRSRVCRASRINECRSYSVRRRHSQPGDSITASAPALSLARSACLSVPESAG